MSKKLIEYIGEARQEVIDWGIGPPIEVTVRDFRFNFPEENDNVGIDPCYLKLCRDYSELAHHVVGSENQKLLW